MRLARRIAAGVKRVWIDLGGSGLGGRWPWAKVTRGVVISAPEHCHLGQGSILYEQCHIVCDHGEFRMGANSHLSVGVYVNATKGKVIIGEGVAVGPKVVILAYSNHYEKGKAIVEVRRVGDVMIGDDVFIGAAAVIFPGVSIGTGAVVGAGAIVNRNVPPYAVVAGNPARVIKHREP